MLQYAKLHYRTCTCTTHFGKTVGKPEPVPNPTWGESSNYVKVFIYFCLCTCHLLLFGQAHHLGLSYHPFSLPPSLLLFAVITLIVSLSPLAVLLSPLLSLSLSHCSLCLPHCSCCPISLPHHCHSLTTITVIAWCSAAGKKACHVTSC